MEILIFLALLGVGFFAGRYIEQRHDRSIYQRELALQEKYAATLRTPPPLDHIVSAQLATGSIVVSVDYFKYFISSLRLLIGGEVRAYASLIERGRREAVLRMKESCPDADIYINTRLETATISGGVGRTAVCVEILCYATAIKLRKDLL